MTDTTAAEPATRRHPAVRQDVEAMLRGRREQIDSGLRQARWGEGAWAWARLAVFIAAALPWLWLSSAAAAALSAAGLALFIATVIVHRRAADAADLLARTRARLDEALARCNGQVVALRSPRRPDDSTHLQARLLPILQAGRTWALTDQERDDLDLFAEPVGIFGLLNRTSSGLGARRLRDWLNHPMLEAPRIARRQAAVAALAADHEARIHLQAALSALREQDDPLDRLAAALCGARPLPRGLPVRLLQAWSVACGLFSLAAVGMLLQGLQLPFVAALALWAVNAGLTRWLKRPLREALTPWEGLSAACGHLAMAIRRIDGRVPPADDLDRLAEPLRRVAHPNRFASLGRRVAWTDAGGPIRGLLNAVALYDLNVAAAILKRAVPLRDESLRALAAVADLDALGSLASFSAEQPGACWPALVDGPAVQIDQGLHPLIPPAEAVANGVAVDGRTRLWLITGPNAAGKSTLLRMTGVNVLLAQMGCAVCAARMAWSPLRLLTDLRVRDDLSRHESYFLSEVRHLRRMVLPAAGPEPILGLIDEPFRGTNAQDQRAASLALVEHLAASGHLFLTATHEGALTDLAEQTPAAANFHFQAEFETPGVVFDYLLRPGPARTSNALRILEREGFPPALVEAARRHLSQG